MNIIEQISFLRKRALLERQMGTNQCLNNNSAGPLRLEKANIYDLCADSLAMYEGEVRALKTELASYKKKEKDE